MTRSLAAVRPRARTVLRLAGLATALLLPGAAVALPSAPAPVEAALSAGDAAEVVASVLGAVVVDVAEDADRFTFAVDGLAKGHPCPLDGVRDVRCGGFGFVPSRIVVMRRSPIAALSGHLARNRVVVVDMASDEAAIASGTLHGVLVFPTDRVTVRDRPAFAWYVSREGAGLDVALRDLDRDGVLDLFYTYTQWMPGGVRVVSRDVWTFVEMRASKMLSSGEKLSGVSTSMFDGVPLHRDDDAGLLRGSWRIVALGDGLPSAVVVEQAHVGRVAGWEMHVIADLGGGWREHLVGTSLAAFPGDAYGTEDGLGDDPNCRPGDATADLGLEARRRLLDLESACRVAASAPRDGTAGALITLWSAWRTHLAGFPLVAAGMAETASRDLARGWPATWPLSALISLDVSRIAQAALRDAFASGWQGAPESWLASARAYPALVPLVAPFEAVRRRILDAWTAWTAPLDPASAAAPDRAGRAGSGAV
jgi:hypothetical protein